MPTKPTKENRESFFYAEAEAGMYDQTIDLVVPHYSTMHGMVLSILDASGAAASGTILDVGSGTGTDSISILKRFPQIRMVSMDLCAPIQAVHQRKLRERDCQSLNCVARSTLVTNDILRFIDKPNEVLEYSEGKPYSAIVTSLVVHHFTHQEKRRFYDLACRILKPGGLFLNADLFSYASQEVYKLAYEYDIAWMNSCLSAPPKDHPACLAIPPSKRKEILRGWIKHYEEFNRLEPLEEMGKGSGQVKMLQDAGFESVGVPYRMSLSGILMGRKPISSAITTTVHKV